MDRSDRARFEQLAALVYGMSIVYLARPAFIVFVKDRFEVITAIELSAENLAEAKYPEFRGIPVTGAGPCGSGALLVVGGFRHRRLGVGSRLLTRLDIARICVTSGRDARRRRNPLRHPAHA